MSLNSTEWPSDTENVSHVTNSTANPVTVEWLHVALPLFFTVIGSLSNGLVIWILGFRMKRDAFLNYVLNLAVADICFCILLSISIPNIIANNYVYGVWLCRVNFYLERVFFCAGTLLITCISLERCLAIRHPIWYQCHRPRWVPKVTCTVAWVVACAVPIAIPINLKISHLPGNIHKCHIMSNTVLLVLSTTEFFLMFLLPLCIIVVSNCIIVHKMVKDHLERRRRSHVNRMVCATIVLFLVCCTPFQVGQNILVMQKLFFRENLTLRTVGSMLTEYCSYLLYLNSCLNPFIYLLMGSMMKKRIAVSIPCFQAVFQRAFSESMTERGLRSSNRLTA